MQIAIVLYKGMTALDAIGPYEVLRFMPQAQIRFVSNKPGPIITDSGVLVLGATHSYQETPKPDLVLVPGSMADTMTAMADQQLILWLKAVHKTTVLTLSVCSGAMVLAAAGILDGHDATTHWASQKYLKNFGAISKTEQRIVKSGKIMTAAGVSAGLDLALTVVKALHGQHAAEVIQLMIEYDPMPPVDAGHLSKASPETYQAAKKQLYHEAKNPRNALFIPVVLWSRLLDIVRTKWAEYK